MPRGRAAMVLELKAKNKAAAVHIKSNLHTVIVYLWRKSQCRCVRRICCGQRKPLEVYSFEGMGSRVYGRVPGVVEWIERGRTGGREGRGEPAPALRTGARQASADSVASSKHANMKELRVQHRGRPYRVLFAFDPRRVAILLIGGDKTGKGRWYREFVPVADRLYDEHLATLRKEGLLDG